MPKILRQNIDNVDYSMAGCALYGTCATAASEFIKAVVLTDGDILSDGMSLAVAFTNGNTAGNAPKTTTIYSSDQVHYYSDSALTQPFTLAPSGCYTITYTGTGNAYTYKSFPVLSAGGVTAPICSMNGRQIGNTAWNAGDIGVFIYTAGKFLLVSVNLDNTTGVLPVAHGGTGQTTQADTNKAIVAALESGSSDVTDGTEFVSSYASDNGFSDSNALNKPYKRSFLKVWNYIKSKLGDVIKAVFANSYWGMASPNGADNVWIRTTTQGIIPYQSGGATAGHQSLGTDSWYFADAYIQNIHGTTIFANNYQLKRYYAIDASSLSASNFYPVTFGPSDLELDCEIHSPHLSGSAAYNQNHIHFLLTWQGWSDTPKRFVVLSYGAYDTNEITIGCIGTGNQDGANCVWVRGGRLYRFYCNRTPTLRTADWSNGNEKFTVGTSQSGGTNANVTVTFQPSNYAAYGSYFKDMIYGTISSSQHANYTYGTAICTTAGDTADKVASMLGFDLKFSTFLITFTNANSVHSALTLNINGTGAKPLYINGYPSSSTNYGILNGTYLCKYNNSFYELEITQGAPDARSLMGIYVRTASIGGISTGSGNHWAYITTAKITTTAGYIVFSNHLCLQWGKTVVPNNVGTKIDFPLTAQYTQPPVVVATLCTSANDPNTRNMFHIYNINTGYFYGFGNSSQMDKITWFAIGY